MTDRQIFLERAKKEVFPFLVEPDPIDYDAMAEEALIQSMHEHGLKY